MEKFNIWADKSTGVRPFVPKTVKISNPRLALRFIFGSIKLILFTLTMIQSFVNLLIFYIIPIPIVSRFLNRVHSFFTYHLVLFYFGLYYTPAVPTPLIRRAVDVKRWRKPSNGDVVFVNCASYINLFWLQARLSPTFVVPAKEGGVHVVSLHKLFIRILFSKSLRCGKVVDFADVVKNAKSKRLGPVVVLAEAAPTNGDGILEFGSLEGDIRDSRVMILGFSHTYSGASPNFVAGRGILHLVQMLGRAYSKMEVKIALDSDVKPPEKGIITKEYKDNTRVILSKLLCIPQMMLSEPDYESFVGEFGKKIKMD